MFDSEAISKGEIRCQSLLGVKWLVAIQHPWTRNALGKLFKLYNKMSKYKIEPSPKIITRETPFNLDPNQHKIKDKTFFFKRKKKTKREILITLIPLIIAWCLDKHNHKSPSFYDYGQVVSISNLFFHIDLMKDSTTKRSVRKVWESPSILLYSILINCSSPMLERFFRECTKISKITLVLLNLTLWLDQKTRAILLTNQTQN